MTSLRRVPICIRIHMYYVSTMHNLCIFMSYPLTGAGLSRMAKCVRWLHEHNTEPFSNGVVSHPPLFQKLGPTPCLNTNQCN